MSRICPCAAASTAEREPGTVPSLLRPLTPSSLPSSPGHNEAQPGPTRTGPTRTNRHGAGRRCGRPARRRPPPTTPPAPKPEESKANQSARFAGGGGRHTRDPSQNPTRNDSDPLGSTRIDSDPAERHKGPGEAAPSPPPHPPTHPHVTSGLGSGRAAGLAGDGRTAPARQGRDRRDHAVITPRSRRGHLVITP